MGQVQDYQVNYDISVKAEGVDKVTKLAEAVSKLKLSKDTAETSIAHLQGMLNKIDAIFRPKGKKRDFSYKIDVNTKNTEEKLSRISKLLDDIKTKSEGIKLVINAGQKIDTKSIKTQAQAVINNQIASQQKEAGAQSKKSVLETTKALSAPLNEINKVVGKVNAALISLQTGREISIKTDVAKERLLEILSLMKQIKGASKMTLGMGMGSPGTANATNTSNVIAYPPLLAAAIPTTNKYSSSQRNKIIATLNKKKREEDRELSRRKKEQDKIWDHYDKEQEREYRKNIKDKINRFNKQSQEEQAKSDLYEEMKVRNELAKEKKASTVRKARQKEQDKIWNHYEKEQEREYRKNIRDKINRFNRQSKEEQARADLYEEMRVRNELAKDKAKEKANLASQKAKQREARLSEKVYGNNRRAAINRLQYAKAPSWRSMPFAGMVSGYMAYGLIKSELGAAVDYANIMESARGILRVADSDLSTFENRFDKMSRNVRQIGIDTKFTAQEIAGATKYLAMAGMNIETINSAMRPITNLALIGDNDVGQVADLTTNIMSGYDIKNSSMGSVADIISSTFSRSNVNIIDMAESYKMAAGYLRMSGVDFSEASAAIGILGNSGIKGTMAGTSLRAMSTKFAKPTKEAKDTLKRLGVKFTEFEDIYGAKVEKLRSIADIFEDLNKAGATLGDMQAVFGKIGGNAAMMFVDNYAALRTLANQNRASHGISEDLAEIKQNTTKGLWAQMTSTFSESFMQAYEILEPVIRSTLKDLLASFKPREFAQGIATIGRVLLDVFSTLGKIGSWVTRNFSWIEPLLFTGVVATKVFKLAGALTNLGIAFGFVGKQALASKTISSVGSVVGAGAGGVVAKQALSGMFSSQVSTGSGLIGASASLSAIGTGAIAATAGISALIGMLTYAAYKTWKVKEAKDAVLEDIEVNRKYRYPSIEALQEALSDTYQQAIDTKKAVDDVTSGKTLSESSGHATGAFTGRWWAAILDNFIPSEYGTQTFGIHKNYSLKDAYQDDIRDAILVEAKKDSQLRVESAYAELGKLRNPLEVDAFTKNIQSKYGQQEKSIDYSLFSFTNDQKTAWKYINDLGDKSVDIASTTMDYYNYQNSVTVPEIKRLAGIYKEAISSPEGALNLISGKTGNGKMKFDLSDLTENGFYQNKNGKWVQKELKSNATDDERSTSMAQFQDIHWKLKTLFSSLRKTFGGSADAADTIMRMAGFSPSLYSNEPDHNNITPWDDPNITYQGGDDGGAGGNYSGTGKLSSAAPKQVIVNITNLLSIQTIELMKTPEGKSPEIQDMKEMMAQALIDVVHDFDASWNG